MMGSLTYAIRRGEALLNHGFWGSSFLGPQQRCNRRIIDINLLSILTGHSVQRPFEVLWQLPPPCS
jgi:hypothetical protein